MTKKDLLEFCEQHRLLNKFQKIKTLDKKNPASIRAHDILNELTSILPKDTKFIQRWNLLMLTDDIKEAFCPVCGDLRKISSSGKKLMLTCGKKDSTHKDYTSKKTIELQRAGQAKREDRSWTEEQRQKFKETCLKKYGASSPLGAEEIRAKAKKTNLEKYGVENPHQSPAIKEKAEKTCLRKYGARNPMQVIEIQEKAKNTNRKKYGGNSPMSSSKVKEKWRKNFREKYGVENPMQLKEIQEKFQQTCLKNWAVRHPIQNQKIQQKIKETSIEKYGVDHPFKSKEVRQRAKQTMLKRYGVLSPLAFPEVREKIRRTNQKMYGTPYPSQNPEVREKIKKSQAKSEVKKKIQDTNRERYGVPFVMQNTDIREKAIATNLQKYGVPYAAQAANIKKKIQDTNMERYGVPHATQNIEIREKIWKTWKKDAKNLSQIIKLRRTLTPALFKELFITKEGYLKVGEAMLALGYQTSTPIYVLTRQLGITYKKRAGTSSFEEEIISFLNENYSEEIIKNTREIIPPFELDIYLPDKNLAIEFNGDLYHSAGDNDWSAVNRTPEELGTKHLDKFQACEKQGIDLIQIPEHQWKLNERFWLELILWKLKLTQDPPLKVGTDGWWDNHWGRVPKNTKVRKEMPPQVIILSKNYTARSILSNVNNVTLEREERLYLTPGGKVLIASY